MHAPRGGGARKNKGERTTPCARANFKILTRRGPRAAGGAKDYVVNGHLSAALRCWRSRRNMGPPAMMTFLVDERGMVLQRDLGRDAARLRRAITAYDPNYGWKPVP